jgi:hypothetical protein
VCERACLAPANGDPQCLGGSCGFSCHAGFGDCTNNPAQVCTALPKWYQDQDGDKVGSSNSVAACTAPAGYVATSGDCLDTNAQVFPGQTASFVTGYTNAAGATSFDYDCNGVESESGAWPHWPGSCAAGCTGYGYAPTGRSGAGVDPYCGSTTYLACVSVPSCQPHSSFQSIVSCH